MDSHIQAKLISKLSGVHLPDYQFSLPSNSGYDELNVLVNKLINESNENVAKENFAFDFLINGVLLRIRLDEFLNEHGLLTEDVISIECISKENAPTPVASLPHNDWVGAIKMTSDYLISGCYDNTVHLWSLKDQKHLLSVPGHAGSVKCLTVMPTNSVGGKPCVRFATGSQDQTLIVWSYDISLNQAECTQIGRGHERSVECLCSNSDGTRLASGSFDNYVKIWSTGDDVSETQDNDGENAAKKLKPNDGENKTTVKTPMVTLAGHREGVSGVCWTAPAEVTTCSWDRSIVLWDLEAAGQKSALNSSTAFTSVAYSKLNGLLVTGATDSYVRLWDPRNKSISSAKAVFSSHNGWVVNVDWSKTNENLFISASYDNKLKLWDVRSFKAPLYDLAGHEGRLLCCDWSNPAFLASGGVDNSVKLYSVPKSDLSIT